MVIAGRSQEMTRRDVGGLCQQVYYILQGLTYTHLVHLATALCHFLITLAGFHGEEKGRVKEKGGRAGEKEKEVEGGEKHPLK